MAPSPTRPPPAASTLSNAKRPTAPLLPAFEPFSSSPALPRPLKRSRDVFDEVYPTPVPTSSTAILSSSPPRLPVTRPSFQRKASTLAERAPLSAVPTIELHADGRPVLMGRSGASCDYQLPSNRLISRIHVEASFKPAVSSLQHDRVEILCSGWNGIKVHCQGQIFELAKGKIFSSDARDAAIMVDVHDTRVMIQWPPKPHLGPISSDEEEEGSPSKKLRGMKRHSTPPSPSPMQTRRRPVSPVSPSPAVRAVMPSSPPVAQVSPPEEPVQIYEDPEPEEERKEDVPATTQSTQVLTQNQPSQVEKSPDRLVESQEFSDNDEENDPIIHSFGRFGANLLPRMASFTTGASPRADDSMKSSRSSHTLPLQPTDSPSQPIASSTHLKIRSHIINQLAFSRLSSTPLSTISTHLPTEAEDISLGKLKQIIAGINCVGEITREGKDAAGKPLESEYYYIPDEDQDDKRKEAVVNDLMKPSLRSCRKQHKQYFWKKPK